MRKGGCHASCIHGRVPSLSPQLSLVGHAAVVHGAVGMAAMGGLRGEVGSCEHELASWVACASPASPGAGAWAEGPCLEESSRRDGDRTTRVELRARGDAS